MTKKTYTDQEEQIARFAKAMGHPPKVRYCINRANWTVARNLFVGFFCDCKDKDSCCG